MKHCLVVLILMCSLLVNAQSWEGLTYSPNQPGLENNPLKGFADLYGPTNDFPRSINGRLFGLDQVMNGLNDFNWTVIDNFIEQNRSDGNFSSIQVNIDPGPNGNNVAQSNMPDFLDGQYESVNVTGPVNDICPDWNDPELMEAMVNFIEAYGARYDTRPEVFLVTLGLYGIYGEWQIGDAADLEPDFEMTLENKSIIANAFKAAFPNTSLMARYPEPMPDPEIFGYSDGLYFTQSVSTNTFFNHFYFDNTIDLYNAGQNWRSHPIGGEIDPCVQPLLWKSWPNNDMISCDPNNPSGQEVDVQNVEQTIEETHPTFLYSHYVFTDMDPVTEAQEWNNAIRAQKKMGYTFHIDKYRLTASGGLPMIEVNVENVGVAPMYANWDVEFGVINTSNNQFTSLGREKWNLNLVQPDERKNYRAFDSEVQLDDGEYTFMLRIVNPLEEYSSVAEPVRFATATQDVNGMIGWLTLGEATISSGSTGDARVTVSGISLSSQSTSMMVGATMQLTGDVSPSNATRKDITWVSDKPGTLSVDENGFATAGPAYGMATITAYTQDGCFTDNIEIIVDPISVSIPGSIEASDYIRMTGVVPGFGKLGFIDDRDWIDYSVTVSEASRFIIDLKVACPNCDDNLNQTQDVGIINIINEEGQVLDQVRLPKTDNFDSFETASSSLITLTAGTHILRIEAKKGAFDINRIDFVLDSTVGVESLGTRPNSVKLFPNPTNGYVTIEIEGFSGTDINVEIIDIYGATLKSMRTDNLRIDLSELPSGLYLIIINVAGEKITKKIVRN